MANRVHEGPWRDENGKRILQCHSRGYKERIGGREVPLFSPFGVTLRYNGHVDSLENHYMRSKVFDLGSERLDYGCDFRLARQYQRAGKRIIGWNFGTGFNESKHPKATAMAVDEWGVQFYIGLWYAFLRSPEGCRRLAIARDFDEFEDPFKGTFPFGQDCVIRLAVREGTQALLPMCIEVRDKLVQRKIEVLIP